MEQTDRSTNGNGRTAEIDSRRDEHANGNGAASTNGNGASANGNGVASANANGNGNGPAGHADRIRVVIADDDPLARRVVRDVLQADGIIVPGEAANSREAVELAVYYRPEIVVMDATMSRLGGISAMRQILERCPEVRIVIFSAAADPSIGLASLRAGASGYLTKDIRLESLPRALRAVVSGEIACSRAFVGVIVEQLRSMPEGGIGMRPVRSKLTPREWEVLDMLCNGYSTDAIAEDLVLSTETVRSHIKNLLRKVCVRSRAEAVALAPELRRFHPDEHATEEGSVASGALAQAMSG